MTDEMRAAESLVRALAPSGHEVPIPEPLALDESRWLIIAVEKGLLEFRHCTDACTHARRACPSARDHFETGSDDPHHLFAHIGPDDVTLHREYVPAIAAYTRAVLDFGYDPTRSVLLGGWPRHHRPNHRRMVSRFSAGDVRSGDTNFGDTDFRDSAGSVQLQILATGDRQITRRIATALDACDRLDGLRPDIAGQVRGTAMMTPRFLWLVGPNTVEPAGHVFRVASRGDSATFTRVNAVPAPV
jgi:hypothetical protein